MTHPDLQGRVFKLGAVRYVVARHQPETQPRALLPHGRQARFDRETAAVVRARTGRRQDHVGRTRIAKRAPSWLVPAGASIDARWVLAARSIRAFADGFVSLLLPIYLLELGFGTFAIGSIITSTLIGSALLTFSIGLVAHRYARRAMLRSACLLMIATGAAFALSTDYWPIVVVAFIGTINPTAGDVSLFLPLEQTVLAQSVTPTDRTALFARYSLDRDAVRRHGRAVRVASRTHRARIGHHAPRRNTVDVCVVRRARRSARLRRIDDCRPPSKRLPRHRLRSVRRRESSIG